MLELQAVLELAQAPDLALTQVLALVPDLVLALVLDRQLLRLTGILPCLPARNPCHLLVPRQPKAPALRAVLEVMQRQVLQATQRQLLPWHKLEEPLLAVPQQQEQQLELLLDLAEP